MKFWNQSFCVLPTRSTRPSIVLTIRSDKCLNPSGGSFLMRLTRVMLQPCTEGPDWIREQVPSDGRVLRGKQLRVPPPIPWSTILRYWKNSSTPSSVHTTMHAVCQLVIGSSCTHKWFQNSLHRLYLPSDRYWFVARIMNILPSEICICSLFNDAVTNSSY